MNERPTTRTSRIEAFNDVILSLACSSNPKREPVGRYVERFPESVRRQLRELTSDDLLSMRRDACYL